MSFPAIASASLSQRAAMRAKTAAKKARRKLKAKRIGTAKESHSSQVERADKVFSLQVRSLGACESGRDNHKGRLQCAHGFSRRYEATRWTRANAFCFCAGCHVYFTHRPLEWDEWLRNRLGGGYEAMRTLALYGGKQDMLEVLRNLENGGLTCASA